MNPQLVGTAGTYYVMAQLAYQGFHAACTLGNAPSVDILVASEDGEHSLCLQVKATTRATRMRGRGENKAPVQLQWALGHRAAKLNSDSLFFAFVDMKDFAVPGIPDVYVVPSGYVYKHCEQWVDQVKWVRFHVDIGEMEQFKNNWNLLKRRLTSTMTAAAS